MTSSSHISRGRHVGPSQCPGVRNGIRNQHSGSNLVGGLVHRGRLTVLAFTRDPLELRVNQLLVRGTLRGRLGGR